MRAKCRKVAGGRWQVANAAPRPSPLAPCHWSLITGHWSLITGHLPLCLCLLLLTLGTGCGLLKTATNAPGKAVRAVTTGKTDRNQTDLVDVQERLLRFADDLFVRLILGFDKLQQGTNAPEPAEVLQMEEPARFRDLFYRLWAERPPLTSWT